MVLVAHHRYLAPQKSYLFRSFASGSPSHSVFVSSTIEAFYSSKFSFVLRCAPYHVFVLQDETLLGMYLYFSMHTLILCRPEPWLCWSELLLLVCYSVGTVVVFGHSMSLITSLLLKLSLLLLRHRTFNFKADKSMGKFGDLLYAP